MTFKEYIKKNPVDLDIKFLNLTNKGLTDLKGIDRFKNLLTLNISYNNIVDINPLSELINLQGLNIGDNNINNLDVILKLNKLAVLSIHRCYNLSNDYYDYVKLYWININLDNNELYNLKNLKKIITINKRKRIIGEL